MMVNEHRVSIEDLPPVRCPAGGDAIALTQEGMAGLWTLRFGLFGCRDDETHGGVLHVEGDHMAGGDGHFVFHGHFSVMPGALQVAVQVVRHGSGSVYEPMFGAVEPVFRLDYLAEAITPDLFEGRIQRGGYPDLRIVMRRFTVPRNRFS